MKQTISIQYIKTIVGELIIGSIGEQLCLVDYAKRNKRDSIDKRISTKLNAIYKVENNYLLEQTKAQLNEFLKGERLVFDIPILMIGSEFQKQVWSALLSIPYGETISYLSLAKQINNKKAVRAVANANGANALGIIIPCHRVIASNGTLGGYAGGLMAKETLLSIEQKNKLSKPN